MLCIYKPEIHSQAIQTEIPLSENSNQLLYNYFREKNKIKYDENENTALLWIVIALV